jgi:hypothetical protein
MSARPTLPSDYRRIIERIGDLYRRVNLGEDDRAVDKICGHDVRVRRVKVGVKFENGEFSERYRYVLEDKAIWETRYRPSRSRLALVEYLYARKDAHFGKL